MLIAVTACDSVAPNLATGVYTLTSVDGRPLPVLRVATVECDHNVVTGGLSLGPTNEISLVVQEVVDCSRAGGTITAQGRGYGGTYTQTGATLTLTVASPGAPSFNVEATIERDGRVVAVLDRLPYAAGAGVLRFLR